MSNGMRSVVTAVARGWNGSAAVPVVFVLLLFSTVHAQPRVEAIVSDTRIVEGQTFTLDVQVENGDIQSVDPGALEDFRIVAGPTSSKSVQIINGVVSTVSTRSWTLLPRRLGKLIVPPMAVRVEGTEYHTQPVEIEVLAVATGATPGDRGETPPVDVFILTEIDKEEVYRGEQVTVTWLLATRLDISSWRMESLPDLTGFWTEELFTPSRLQLRQRTIDGHRYNVGVARRMALFPTQSGELTIEPLVMKVGVQLRPQRSLDPFFDDFPSFLSPGRIENRLLAAPEVTVRVKPIPREARPSDYTGAVGRYSLAGNLDRTQLRRDEAVSLTVSIKGEGNFKMLEPPALEFPQGLEVFNPKITNEASLGDIIGGSKTLEYVIIPRQAGTYTIPVVRLPYFDPKRERYVVSSAGPFTLEVLPGETPAGMTSGYNREEVALLGKDIRFLKSETPRWLRTGGSWYTPGLFLLNLGTLLLFMTPWLVPRARSLATIIQPRLRAQFALNRANSIIQKAEGDAVRIYGQFSRAVTLYLNDKLRQNVQEYTGDEVMHLLRERGVDQDTRATVAQVLERAAETRFAPISTSDLESDREALIDALKRVEAQWSA
jgi:hypothetical protein